MIKNSTHANTVIPEKNSTEFFMWNPSFYKTSLAGMLLIMVFLTLPTVSRAEIKLGDYVTATINSRYKFENIDDNSKAEEDNISTLRTRIGLQTAEFSGLSSYFEFENTTLLGSANFDNHTNNKPSYHTTNDAVNNEIHQFYVNYKAPLNNEIRLGRQEMSLDDRRFVGNSGWAQNGQSFDGIKITNTILPYLKATYAHLNRVIRNRGIYADGSFYNMDTNLLNLNFTALNNVDGFTVNLIPFLYSIQIDEDQTLSSNTVGLRSEIKKKISDVTSVQLLLEGATQKDFDKNPNSYELGYYRIEPKMTFGNFTVAVGMKVFEGNRVSSFQTPLASQHGFHGWSDMITRIPVNGLSDKHIEVSYNIPADYKCEILKGTKFTVAYFNEDSDDNSQSYGKEYNFEIVKTINKKYAVGLKYADYKSEGLFADTQKATITFEIKF
jgi:Alginate export